MVKISGLPNIPVPAAPDKIPIVDDSGNITGYTTHTQFLDTVPDSSVNTADLTRLIFDHVASGGVWSGDAYASTRNASMTTLVCYINGLPITIAAVTARSFTASKDTYIDVLSNGDNTGTLVYTEVTNNAASPALASNSIRIGIIVTGASNIASVASINQGQETKVLPIASSIPYQVTDSLGNLICPRDPQRRILGTRRILADFTTASTTPVQVTGLTCPVIVPTGRRVRITAHVAFMYNSGGTGTLVISIWDGTVGSGTELGESGNYYAGGTQPNGATSIVTDIPAVNSKTYNVGFDTDNNTGIFVAGSTRPAKIIVELV
jgi:hypothetical protein